jgi:hypothetical protein
VTRQGVAQVPHQVQPIDDLHRLWGAVPNPFGIKPTPIAADDLDTRVCLQPRRDRWGRANGKQVNDLMALEITHNSPKAPASPPGPFVEPNHPWSGNGRERRTMDQPPRRPVTPREAQRLREPHTGTTAYGDAYVQ